MSEYTKQFERAGARYEVPDLSMEGLVRRRDRKRRNQRIAAGVVGIAVFVAAVWIVTSVGSFDRTQTPAVPGPTETGPTETGPIVAPKIGSDAHWFSIPPAGTAVSTPVEGELIAASKFYPSPYVRVYADGRVLSTRTPGDGPFVEQRLSPEGVELVRSGAVQPKDLAPECLGCALGVGARHLVPASAWEDREGKLYVPARYGACFSATRNPLNVEAAVDLLPAPAQALLRGSDPALQPRCLELAPEEARSLEAILSEAGLFLVDYPLEMSVGEWLLSDGNGDQFISLKPLFPDGRRFINIPF